MFDRVTIERGDSRKSECEFFFVSNCTYFSTQKKRSGVEHNNDTVVRTEVRADQKM